MSTKSWVMMGLLAGSALAAAACSQESPQAETPAVSAEAPAAPEAPAAEEEEEATP